MQLKNNCQVTTNPLLFTLIRFVGSDFVALVSRERRRRRRRKHQSPSPRKLMLACAERHPCPLEERDILEGMAKVLQVMVAEAT